MKEVKLGDIVSFSQGQQIPFPDQESAWFEDSDVFIRIVNYTQNSNEFRYIKKQNEKYIVDENDIIMVRYGAVGFVGRGLRGVLANNMFKLNFAKYKIDSDFLYRVLWSDKVQKQLQNASQSTSMAALNFKTVSQVIIPLPPLATQQKIAAILDAADAYRQKTKTLIDKYDQLAQALFLDMFGDPVRNEKGWEKKKLGSITNISSGSTPSRENDSYYIGKNHWVKTTELKGIVINDSLEKISDEALKNTSCKLYPKGTILIAMYGQGVTRGKVGILGIEAATNQACAALPPSKKMDSFFLFNQLKFSYEELRSLGRGGNQPNLNSGLVKEFMVLNPPLDLQNQFAERIQLIEAQKQQARTSLQKAEDLFNSLLQRAFKGEIG